MIGFNRVRNPFLLFCSQFAIRGFKSLKALYCDYIIATMPINTKYQATFKHGSFYHVFNRSVEGINLFSNEGNYIFFLHKFSEYLSGILDVYAWCLLPNHFHFLVFVREFEDCLFSDKEINELRDHSTDIHTILTRRFKNFFLCYSHSYKRQLDIKTNIFNALSDQRLTRMIISAG